MINQEAILFAQLLRELQKIDPEFPLQYAICLVEISCHRGLSMTELSEQTGMPMSTISRIVGALSKKRQKGQAFGLVKVTICPEERRRKAITLTSKGKAVMDSIYDLLR